MGDAGPIRFSDVLTTASAVADYLGESDVRAAHLVDAIDILLGARGLDDLGRPTSPLVRRPSTPGATQPVKDLVQRWFADLGDDPHAELDAAAVLSLREEAESLASTDSVPDP